MGPSTSPATFRLPKSAVQELVSGRLRRSRALLGALAIMVVGMVGAGYAYSRGNALLALGALGLGLLILALAFGFLYLYVTSIQIDVTADHVVRSGFPFPRRSVPRSAVKKLVRSTVDWGYGALQPLWFATDGMGLAQFTLDADLWPESVLQDLARALGAEVEGSWETIVYANELRGRFAGGKRPSW